jgi:hypothetical protein
MSRDRYHDLAREDRLRAQDEILDLVGETKEEFEETSTGDVLMVRYAPAPEIQDALRARGCKLKSDEVNHTLIVVPRRPRVEDRVLDAWTTLIQLNAVMLLGATGMYLWSAYQNENRGF